MIKRYDDLAWEILQEAGRINTRFQTREWKPIIVLKSQHSHRAIEPYYRAADVCMVTSLHDGMNLVAKEFVAARHDDDGDRYCSVGNTRDGARFPFRRLGRGRLIVSAGATW